MTTLPLVANEFTRPMSANAFAQELPDESLRHRTPAAFAERAHPRVGPQYTFIPTQRVLAGLREAGFVPVDAQQARVSHQRITHTRHLIRLRRHRETVQLKDSIPEIVFVNSHDGTSAYRLQLGLYRCVCRNGLIVSHGSMPGFCVAHRGDVVDRVIEGALGLAARFETLAWQVVRMEHRALFKDEQTEFAERALALKYPDLSRAGMPASSLLTTRRREDVGENLWTVLNRVQENLIAGGISRHAANGRLTRTRAIRSIRTSMRINTQLWELAAAYLDRAA